MGVITRRSFIAMATPAACLAGRAAPRAETAFDFYLGKPPFSESDYGLRRLYRELAACGMPVFWMRGRRGTVSTRLTAYGGYFPAAFGRVLSEWRSQGKCRAVSITRDDWWVTAWTEEEMRALVAML